MSSTRTARRQLAGDFIRLPGSRKPFKAALKLMDDMRAVVDKGLQPLERQMELDALPALVHRGHGGRHRPTQRLVGSRQFQDRSKYDPREEDMKRHCGLTKLREPVPGYSVPELLAYVDAIAAKTKHGARAA